tara:strand:- start:368 stop:568 length:201 start_codon:yes stop_codon:yes gene_type:complete
MTVAPYKSSDEKIPEETYPNTGIPEETYWDTRETYRDTRREGDIVNGEGFVILEKKKKRMGEEKGK